MSYRLLWEFIMEKWLFDFDDFMGKSVLVSSFSGDALNGVFSDYTDEWIELCVDNEYIQIPIEPIRTIKILE